MQVGDDESSAQPGESEKSSKKVWGEANIRLRLPVARLPMMPQVLSRLFDACHGETVGTDELVSIVSLDPGIAARVIAVASSSVIDKSTRPRNLTQCVTLVGLGVIKAIAINESATRVFGRLSFGPASALTRAWFHALRSALLAKALAVAMHYPDPEEAYLAGLVHDIGSLALMAIDPNGYPQLLNRSVDEKDQCRLELEQYQTTHADIGTWIAEQWPLDSFVADSIRYHHVPAERLTTAHPLLRIVLLADHLAGVDMATDGGKEIESAQLCGAPPESVAHAINRANEDLNRIANQLGIRHENGLEQEPTSGLRAMPNHAICGLENRLEEKLLLDHASSLMADAKDTDAILRRIAQAVLMLFGLQPSLFFLREGHSDVFVGKALLPQHAKVSQLTFVTKHADSAVAMAVSGTPTVWFARDNGGAPLDAQLTRLLDAEGMVCIPMGSGSQCKGLIVSAINSRHHADTLDEKMDTLRSFGKLANSVLEAASAENSPAAMDDAPKTGASPEQIKHLLHEVSNPLSIVRNYLSTLEMSMGHNATGKKELRIVTEEIGRISQILDSFRQLPHDPASATGPVPLDDLIRRVLDLCEGLRLKPPLVKIEVNLQATSTATVAHQDKLKQVLLNLLKNAFEAMPDGGTLKVSTFLWGDGRTGNYVEIVLEDSGPGLPAEIQRSLYQPVTSAKGGQHFGIGLSIVGQLVREMSGLINCRSDQNGSCFHIMLPFVTS